MSAFEHYFAIRVNEIVSKHKDNTLIFFKGFNLEQTRFLITHPHSLLNDLELLENGYVSIESLGEKWFDIMASIKQANGPLVGFYEELLSIKDLLPRLKVKQIVVVENNSLGPWIPCNFQYSYALRLFDFFQEEHETTDESFKSLTRFFGDVKLLSNQRALLLPIALDDEEICSLPFWTSSQESDDVSDDAEQIEVGSQRDWEYCLELLDGTCNAALFLQSGDVLSSRHCAILGAAQALGVGVAVDELELYKEKYVYDDRQFLPTLKKYWGPAAAFRPLLFYKDPDRSRETEVITQGQIIAEIVDQCEAANDGDPYSNIFITAPTGAGKSILFQIPAVYLAEKYNLVTIVVSPLIALMNDQVDQLHRERGISIAACINSTMTMDERSETIEQIHQGKKSLIYLAPELLLTTHLEAFLGGRKVGLVVIDEAHTVTSWGRDFRSDYWFLGDFLKKTRRNGMMFPVLCLTATAVYSGEDDVVNDTITELGLEKTIIHLGNVKRENIDFDIVRHDRSLYSGSVENVKMELTLKRIREFVAQGEKVLTYFPYRSQVDQIYGAVGASEHRRIRRYHGQIPSAERKLVERDYKSGEAMGLFCTKAFGMGIDVGDIKHVVHFAPTGTLADYVQEIGRAARNPDIQGLAHIDFFSSDLRYVRALNSISEMRQYQLKEMLKKLCDIYSAKKRRNLLISAETFEYLFKEEEVENRTKSGLMLLAKDLGNKYSFPVLIVRPKAMLSKNYVNVPAEIEEQFIEKYGQYAKLQSGVETRVIASRNQIKASDITVYSSGNTYLVDMAAIWENCYPDKAFGMFKKTFFEEEFSTATDVYHVAPRARVDIRYSDDYSSVVTKIERVVTGISEIFGRYKNAEIKQFTLQQFEAELTELLGEKVVSHDKVSMLLDVFTESVNENAAFTQNRSQIRVLRKRRQAGSEETVYFVSSVSYTRLANFFNRQIDQCAPNAADNTFYRFYPLTQNRSIEIMPLLRVLELLNLASYEIRGGEKAEVFVRINDPSKILRLANSKYTNNVLQAIQERHRSNAQLLAAFFSAEMPATERWELIEQYFLGNGEYVRDALSIRE